MLPTIQKSVAALLSVFLTVQASLGHAAESSFWAERHRQKATLETDAKSPQLAALAVPSRAFFSSLPSIQTTLPEIKNSNESLKRGSAKIPKNLQGLVDSIPSTVGSVQEVYDSGNRAAPPIVLIQDVHLNPEAQQNIALLLQQLVEQKRVGLVGVEGAFTPFDFEPFRSISNRQVTKEVVDAFLNKGLLAAPSYVGITSPIDPPLFIGLDNKEHYDANVNAYLSTRGNKEKIIQELDKVQRNLTEAKYKTFSKELLGFDNLRVVYTSGQIGIGSYLKQISKYPIDLDFTTEQFLKAYELELTLDFKQVESQRRMVIEKLTKTLSEVELQQLVS